MWGDDEFDLEEILAQESTAPAALQKALIEAAQNGNVERLGEILGSPEASELVDVNQPDETGSCALIYAACYSIDAAVVELLRFGANPNVTDSNKWSPLMWAVQNQSLGIVQRLVEQGASVDYSTEARSALTMCTPQSAVYQYFCQQGYIKDESTGFYQAALDPQEEEDKFRAKLEESSQALGIEIQFDERPGLTGIPEGLAEPQDEFDWMHNHVSFALSPKDAPALLDLLIGPVVPFHKGVQPVAANCLFLVLRHYCWTENEGALVGLLTSSIQRIDKVSQNTDDLKLLVYWLVNVHALYFYLQRDPKCADQTGEFLPALNDLFLSLFSRVVDCAKRLVAPLLKPCILDFENIPGIDTIKYRGDWHLWRKKEAPLPEIDVLPPSLEALRKPAPRRVTAVLSSLMLVLQVYSVHPVTLQAIYSQLLYWIGATLFNSVVRNSKYMARARAMQIRLNLSNIEDWCHNNNQRPADDALHSGPPTYKSLDQLCKTHLSSVAEMLQWLQCFSGFGSDFTNVVATMQELKELNPRQLLYAAKHYRAEVNEPALDKEYKRYLQDLESHYSQQPLDDLELDSVLLRSAPVVSRDIFLDEDLLLTVHAPSFIEMLMYWGGGADGSERSAHYFRPAVPAEIADELEERVEVTGVYEDLEMPRAQMW